MWRSGARGVVAFGLMSVACPAFAEPGDHIRVGDAIISPSLSAGLGYHTNVYLQETDPVGAPDLTLSPRIELSLDRPDWQLASGLGYQLRKFIDTAPDDGINVQNLDRFNDVDANLGLNILRRSLVGVRLADRFQVANTPAELGGSETSANIVTTSNDLNGGLLFRPGSAIEIGALGQFGFDHYRVPDSFLGSTNALNYNDRSTYGPTLQAQWTFLPKTSVQVAGSMVWNRWRNNLIAASGPEIEGLDYGDFLGKPDSSGWRAMAGLKGQVTQKVSAELSFGYGQLRYDEQSVIDAGAALSIPTSSSELDLASASPDAENFARDLTSFGEGSLALVQFAYVPLKGHALNLGYKKDYQDAFFTNYVTFHYVYLRYQGTLLNKLKLSPEVGLRMDHFHGEVSRADRNLVLKGQAAYAFSKFLSANAGIGWNERACGASDCSNGAFEPTEYDDVYGTLGVTLTW